MSYNPKRSGNYVNLKLTDLGRRQATQGKLNFHEAVFSDREVNYSFKRNAGTSEEINLTIGEREESSIGDLSNNRVLSPASEHPPVPTSNFDLTSPYLLTFPDIKSFTTTQTAMTENIGMFKALNTGTTSSIEESDYVVNDQLYISSGLVNTSSSYSNLGYDDNPPTIVQVGDFINLTFQKWYDGVTEGYDAIREKKKHPFVSLTYKIRFKSENQIYFDRTFASYITGSNNIDIPWYTYPSLSAEAYYGSGVTYAPDVWNLNIVRTKNIVGDMVSDNYQTYGSLEFNGTKKYLGFEKNLRSIAIVHYTNSYKGSVYGDALLAETIQIDLPTVLWHHYDSMPGRAVYGGLRITDIGQENQYDNIAKTSFRNLADKRGNVVGRAYMSLKVFVITDPELVTVLSYKSNRSWTLPKPHVTLVDNPKPPLNLENTTPLLNDGDTLLVSYVTEADTVYVNQFQSLGFRSSMHCEYIQRIDCQGSSKYVNVTFPDGGFPYMRSEAGFVSHSGSGWSANRVKLIAHKMRTADFTDLNSIDTENWVRLGGAEGSSVGDGAYEGFTSTDSIDPTYLQAHKFIISQEDYDAGVAYEMGDFFTAGQEFLTAGDETFLYGNVQVGTVEKIHKTTLTLSISNQYLNTSANPTFDFTQDRAYITEVGILNTNGELVAVGKTTHPVRKTDLRFIVFQLEFDF